MDEIIRKFKKPNGKREVFYLEIKCHLHNTVYTIKSNHYNSGVRSCGGCRQDKRLYAMDVDRHLITLSTIHPHYTFCFEGNSVVKYTCSRCNEGEEVFQGSLDKLKNGQVGCRCRKYPKHLSTKEFRQQQVDALILNNPTILSATVVKYVTAVDSEILLVCKTHGESTATVNNFVNHGSRCGGCNSKYGYYSSRDDETDNLYLLRSDCGSFHKIGRSFNVNRRLRVLNKTSGLQWVLLDKVTSTHKEVFYREQDYLKVTYDFCVPSLTFNGASEVREFNTNIHSFSELDTLISTSFI